MVDQECETLLTIVIPYYNTFNLTCNLLDSIKAQCSSYIEVILVDDGCNEVAFDYMYGKWVNVIHQENGGVSSARNTGIKAAHGKYIAFVDSDDMVMPNYIETLLLLITVKQDDIIYFNWLDVNTNDVIRHPGNPAVWKAIYKKEIIPMFDETLKVKEDFYFLQELKEETHTRYYYDKVLYIYNSGRENSLTWKNKRGEI